jgi:hypothetical protein
MRILIDSNKKLFLKNQFKTSQNQIAKAFMNLFLKRG